MIHYEQLPYKPKDGAGLDYDHHNEFGLLRRYFNLRSVTGLQILRVCSSASGKGFHIYAERAITFKEAQAAGDCQGRLAYWERQNYTFTFVSKGIRGKVKGVETDINILAKPFWSQLRVRKPRRRRREVIK